MKDVKILVATHKEYAMPTDDIYLPVQVGASGRDSIGFQKDDDGENISNKNDKFCELTALYWAWKNLDVDYVGLNHYRRYFKGKHKFKVGKKNVGVADRREIENLLENTDVILPKKRNYYIENLYSHYSHTLYVEPLDATGEIISEKYPDYYAEFLRLKKRTSAHMFNIFVMKKNVFDDYCQWLFDILFELEKKVDSSKYSAFHARFFGRVSELLLDVYINCNDIKYKERAVTGTEKSNFFKKAISFLKAKLFKKKYEASF